ncbi:MAG: HAD-IB family hydrolase [Spirochaeta sp.]|jgi:HAD superfamily hydrolase (TIGR01490 family)|nr:HAD-IB family hydrolase [Spirochaeta sp.]
MIPAALTTVLKRAQVHIFDVDHTLTRHSTGRRFVQVGHRAGLFPTAYLLSLPFFYLRYRMGKLGLQHITREIKPITGCHREELAAVAADAWQQYIRADLYPAAERYIAACREGGAAIILASTSFDIILQPLAAAVGADETISSILEFRDDRATGWLEGGPCYAEQKARRLAETLERRDIPPAACAFYSDSFHDLPSLDLVGFPVAVHPDPVLRRVAHRRAWPIASWTAHAILRRIRSSRDS